MSSIVVAPCIPLQILRISFRSSDGLFCFYLTLYVLRVDPTTVTRSPIGRPHHLRSLKQLFCYVKFSMTTTTHMTSGLSALFSLSHLAASASPIPVPDAASSDQGKDHLSKDAKDAPAGKNGSHTHAQKHRRLSSTGQMRRRLSDAKDAASRTRYEFPLLF